MLKGMLQQVAQDIRHACDKPYWLAHTIRAIHSTSSAASVRSAWAGLSDCQLQCLRGPALQFADHHFAGCRLHHHAVAAADRRARRHHDDVAVAIGRLDRIAGNLQRVGMILGGRRQRHLVPAPAGGIAAVVEMAAAAGLRQAKQRHRLQPRAPSPINCTKVSIEVPVAASALASDSVDGQRSRPSAVTRLDLLKVVGSSPARRASPEGDSPARSASRSSAAQTWPWVSIRGALGCLAIGNPGIA